MICVMCHVEAGREGEGGGGKGKLRKGKKREIERDGKEMSGC